MLSLHHSGPNMNVIKLLKVSAAIVCIYQYWFRGGRRGGSEMYEIRYFVACHHYGEKFARAYMSLES